MNDPRPNEWLENRVRELETAVQSLESSERRLASIFRASPTGIGLVSERVLLEVNDLFCEMLGYSRDELIGQNAQILYPSEKEFLYVGEDKYRQIQEKGTGTLETVMKRKDGGIIDVLMSSTPLDQEDLKVGVTFTALDITDQKKAEKEKAAAEAKLLQTQKVEAIGQLAGGVAHDLNNLLSPIIGFTELLLDEKDAGNSDRESLEQILKAGMGARDLVRQLLAFSRKQNLEYRHIDLNETIRGLMKFMRRTLREDIDFRFLNSPQVVPVMADLGQIEQVILNLAINAADAMPEGGVLTMETQVVDLDENYVRQHPESMVGPHVMLGVSDTGHGMDDVTCGRVFEPFFSTKGEQGTGLGLATVYGIVKQHKGNIWVYSEQGRGSTFKVYLPAAKEAPSEVPRRKSEPGDVQGNETILLVEDNDQVREIAKIFLERLGYNVLVADRGSRALEILRESGEKPDLLMTDVVMPGMNGRELHYLLRQEFSDLKVLYMSGYTNNVIAHHGIIDPGINFLEKPFTREAMGAKLRQVLAE